jgi:hypothetical protein
LTICDRPCPPVVEEKAVGPRRWRSRRCLRIRLPACWILLQANPASQGNAWAVAREAYRPLGIVLAIAPPDAQEFAAAVVNIGRTGRTAFVVTGGGAGILWREDDRGQDYTVIYALW